MSDKYNWIRNVALGADNSFSAILLRSLLRLLSPVYRLVVGIRNWAFDKRILPIRKVPAPVISIGNLTVGGTGKTPMVIWLAEKIQSNHQVAIVSRGYGAKAGRLNDEGLEIAHRLDDVVQMQDRNRFLAAQQAIERIGNERRPVILLDDGFQHRKLHRDLNIVLVDATNPFGNGRLIPGGLLREPITSIRRAQVAVLTRSDQVDPDCAKKIKRQLLQLNPDLIWAEAATVVCGLRDSIGQVVDQEAVQGKQVVAFCGIGNPAGFEFSLQQHGVECAELVTFPDHHDFTESDLQKLVAKAKELHCSYAVCTGKDMVKIQSLSSTDSQIPVLALTTEIAFLIGEQELLAAVERTIA